MAEISGNRPRNSIKISDITVHNLVSYLPPYISWHNEGCISSVFFFAHAFVSFSQHVFFSSSHFFLLSGAVAVLGHQMLLLDEVRRPLRHHDHGDVDVAGGDGGHGRGVHHAEAGGAVHAEPEMNISLLHR